jgi:hypothetical protein
MIIFWKNTLFLCLLWTCKSYMKFITNYCLVRTAVSYHIRARDDTKGKQLRETKVIISNTYRNPSVCLWLCLCRIGLYIILHYHIFIRNNASILPMHKHRKWHSDICHRGKTLITRYQASREPHDVISAQLLIVVWKMLTFSKERFVVVSEAEPSTDIDHSYP